MYYTFIVVQVMLCINIDDFRFTNQIPGKLFSLTIKSNRMLANIKCYTAKNVILQMTRKKFFFGCFCQV